MFDKRLLKNLDYVIIAVVVLLTTISFFCYCQCQPGKPILFCKTPGGSGDCGGAGTICVDTLYRLS